MTPPPGPRTAHEAHVGNHRGYACGFSGPHCWECSEPWPCRVSRDFPLCDGCAESDLECKCNPHTGMHGTPLAIEAEASQEPARKLPRAGSEAGQAER